MNVSKKFSENFKKVCEHYECKPEEVEEMKAAVKLDYEGAKVCFEAMAKEISAEVA
jgi:hypothetical protein